MPSVSLLSNKENSLNKLRSDIDPARAFFVKTPNSLPDGRGQIEGSEPARPKHHPLQTVLRLPGALSFSLVWGSHLGGCISGQDWPATLQNVLRSQLNENVRLPQQVEGEGFEGHCGERGRNSHPL